MTETSDSSREGESSRHGAAGGSPASGVNAVYGEIVSGDTKSRDGEIAGSVIVPVTEPAAQARARRGKCFLRFCKARATTSS